MNSQNGPLSGQATVAQLSKRGGQKKSLPDSTDSCWSEHPDTRALLNALATLKSGDFSVRLPLDWVGIAGKVADTFNEVVALNRRMSRELGRLRESVGREGRINQRASLGVRSAWIEKNHLEAQFLRGNFYPDLLDERISLLREKLREMLATMSSPALREPELQNDL